MEELMLSAGDRVSWNAHTLTDTDFGGLGTVIKAELLGPYLSANYEVRWDNGNVRHYCNGHLDSLVKCEETI